MTDRTETHPFQAEARQLLDLVIHSLYKKKEIYLRELISNASDALDKIRFQALTHADLLAGDERLAIRLESDPAQRLLRISDNGIGMDRDDLVASIGTIARSGTREFLDALKQARDAGTGEAGGGLPELIGQFGVGFYSAFMVADEVEILTRKAGAEQGWLWRSRGQGNYTIDPAPRDGRGTTITLLLKRDLDESELLDLAGEHGIRRIVRKYSDFVAYPIEMEVEREEGEGQEKKKVRSVATLNSMKPLWTRPAAEIREEEHGEFYRHLSHDWEAPAATIHYKAEGTVEYTALLYVPAHRPLDLFDPARGKASLSLYVKRVFIMDDCEELLPPWLRFLRGVLDSADLPLNVSRETLQHNRQMAPIAKHLVSRTLAAFKKLLEDDRERYEKIWRAFGAVLKEGVYLAEEETRYRIAEVCLFESSAVTGLVSLDEYVEKMPFKQDAIYYLCGADRPTLESSPHLEAFRSKEMNVLLLTDPVDAFAMERLGSFDGRPVKSIEKGEIDLADDAEKQARDERRKELEPLLERVEKALGGKVRTVRFSARLTESAAVLVSDEDALSPHMRRLLKEARHALPAEARILELNPGHPLMARLAALREAGDDARFDEYCELLHGQALLAEGGQLPDAARFNRLLAKLMVERG